MSANEKHAATYHCGEYTPSELALITAWADQRRNLLEYTGEPFEGVVERTAQAQRTIAKVRAEAKAEALEEAADALNPELINYRRDAMEALSQPIRPAGGDSNLSLQLALVAANRTADWLRARANQYKEEPADGR